MLIPPVKGHRFINVFLTMTRFEYEELIQPLLRRLRRVIEDVLARAGVDPVRDIDDILLVGEMTRTPAILAVMRDVFRQEPLHSDVASPGTVVAMGAAIRADMLMKLLQGVPQQDLPRITFDERSLQYEKHLSYTGLLAHRARRWAKEKAAKWTDRARARREHVSERRARLKMERGLTDAQIEEMSKEAVGMEMWMTKQAMCDKVVDEAEKLLIDITSWKDPRQGFQDARLDELVELLKFWLNVVRDSRAGEEQLAQSVWELRFYFDELTGGKGDDADTALEDDPDQHLENKNTAAPGEPIRVFTKEK